MDQMISGWIHSYYISVYIFLAVHPTIIPIEADGKNPMNQTTKSILLVIS